MRYLRKRYLKGCGSNPLNQWISVIRICMSCGYAVYETHTYFKHKRSSVGDQSSDTVSPVRT